MMSFQAGASIAKTLIPNIGAPGTAALRVGLGALIVAILQRPWRHMPKSWKWIVVYGLSLGTMNLVFYMSLRTIPLGIAVALEFTGPLAVAGFTSRRISHFVWLGLAVVGLLFLLPLNLTSTRIDPVGAGFVDVLVLADQAADLAADRPGAGFERRVGERLARLDRGTRPRPAQHRQEDEQQRCPFHLASSASSGSTCLVSVSGSSGPTWRKRMMPSRSTT